LVKSQPSLTLLPKLVDGKNLLLYQNILELSYSSVGRVIKEANANGLSRVRAKKAADLRAVEIQIILELMSRNFVNDACKVIGDEYRLPVKRAMKKLRLKVDALLLSISISQ